MSIRDIIEKWHSVFSNYAQHGYTASVHPRDFEEMRDDLAIALEEVALMEAVCDAAKRKDDGRFGGRSLHYCIADLTAFRKERGL